ncbi:N-acetylmuramic acid 6-phosphate etherase [Pseudogracilibacillus auburnensis]|uniref:N-acetylmuramic acid 6-phosphate etherase n=1 Tax=Pseudogracilibacillus auburnensis TaxID=1494959 RepID=A0A2V3VV89_9BACI|nr:N-acetylmuramic acid 6-phosphate etherase [Pseudogracilibacillus auburnensis]MBO1004669.1 N-acetylmuramic acid 6-phosphate etherase [Pseudogracilibacillus auburnensis]PXW85576.1 N-acetylmuramic acid 6-phosphate etherase [Pseudogracilibacillus auburnensis]
MKKMLTEMRNTESNNLHQNSIQEIIHLINEQDKKVPYVVEKALPQIEKAIEVMVKAIEAGSHVVYFGAGTSGRLGVLDASECPPTFGVSPELIKGVIAGGDKALREAIENAEDSPELGMQDVQKYVKSGDVVIGIASSGRTPYVLGAIREAKQLGAKTVGISCNENTELSKVVDVPIELPVGAEVVTGSTRLKAGTAQKMVLNMLSTVTMIKTGKVYENLMINLQATNEKLRKRAVSIITELTGVDIETAQKANEKANGDTQIAILILMFGTEVEETRAIMEKHRGNFVKALNELNKA